MSPVPPIDVKRERLITELRHKTGLWDVTPEFVLSATEGTLLRALMELRLALRDLVQTVRREILEDMIRIGRAVLWVIGR